MCSIYQPIPIKRSSHYGSNYWESYSYKLNRTICLFSDLEYDNWILVECNPEIITYCEQPFQLNIHMSDRTVRSIPDMWVKYRDGTEMIHEVKYQKELDPQSATFSKRSALQIEAQIKWCKQNNVLHEIRTDETIRSNQVYLDNLKTILPYLGNPTSITSTFSKSDLLHTIHNNGHSITIQYLLSQFHYISPQIIISNLVKMILNRTIHSDIQTQYFNLNSKVWLDDTSKMDD